MKIWHQIGLRRLNKCIIYENLLRINQITVTYNVQFAFIVGLDKHGNKTYFFLFGWESKENTKKWKALYFRYHAKYVRKSSPSFNQA
jgi:hypothetical protein